MLLCTYTLGLYVAVQLHIKEQVTALSKSFYQNKKECEFYLC